MVTPWFASGLHSDKGVHSDLLVHGCSGVGVGSTNPTAAGAAVVESSVKAFGQRLAIVVGPPPCTTLVSDPPLHETRHTTATKKMDARQNQGANPGWWPKSEAASLRRFIVFPFCEGNRVVKNWSIAKRRFAPAACEKNFLFQLFAAAPYGRGPCRRGKRSWAKVGNRRRPDKTRHHGGQNGHLPTSAELRKHCLKHFLACKSANDLIRPRSDLFLTKTKHQVRRANRRIDSSFFAGISVLPHGYLV